MFGLEIPTSITALESGTREFRSILTVPANKVMILTNFSYTNVSELIQDNPREGFAYVAKTRRNVDYPLINKDRVLQNETNSIVVRSVFEAGDSLRIATEGVPISFDFNFLELRN